MNCLSILLAIVFVSYSLGAPENLSESQIGDQNLNLKNDSYPELEKHGENVNDGTSTSDSSEIVTCTFGKPTTGIYRTKNMLKPKVKNPPTYKLIENTPDVQIITTGICAGPCASGAETNTCLACISKNVKNQYRSI